MKISKKTLRKLKGINEELAVQYVGTTYCVTTMVKSFLRVFFAIFDKEEIVGEELTSIEKDTDYLDCAYYKDIGSKVAMPPKEVIEFERNRLGIASGDVVSTSGEVRLRLNLIKRLLPTQRIDGTKLKNVEAVLAWIDELESLYVDTKTKAWEELRAKFPELDDHEISEKAEEDERVNRIYRRLWFLENSAFGLSRGDVVTFDNMCALTLKLIREIVI